jgi:hypothetical protein
VAAHVLLPARVIVTAGDRPGASGGGAAAGGPGPAPGTPPALSPADNPPLTTGAGDG